MTGAVGLQIVWAAVAIGVAIVMQMAGFSLIVLLLERWRAKRIAAKRSWRAVAMGIATYLLFLIHLVQILEYAMIYYATGAIPAVRSALYFSAATFTTLGGHQLETGRSWELFTALESLAGIVLVGASVSFLVAVVHRMRFWAEEID